MKGHYVFQRRVLAAGMCLLLIGILMSSLVWAVSPSSAPPAQDKAPAGEQAAPDVAPAQAGSRSARLDPPNPKRAVREAWEKARDAGVYAFATDLTEVTYPARTLSNVGRSPQRAELHLEGEIDQPARTMSFRLSQPGLGTSSETGNEVRVEGDRAYTRQAGGEWQEVQDFTSSFAPDNDPLAFLAGIQNIADCELQARSPAQVACYRFDMDGPALAAYLRDRLERELAEAGELPQSVSLDAPASVRDMTGYGELWVDGRGLPLRLTAHLVFPEQPDGSYSVADVQTNLSGFPEETAAAPAFSSDPVAWTGAALGLDDPSLPARAAKTGGIGGVAACSLVAMALLLAHRRSRRLYVAIVLAVILSMVVVPLIESERVVAFFEHQEARAQDPMTLGADGQLVDAQTAQEQEAARQALADSLEPTWDPQQDLLAQAPTAPQTTEVGLTTSLG